MSAIVPMENTNDMTIAQSMLPEFDHEMANTRKTLARVPDGKFAYKPHDKSMTLGQLAGHLAQIPGWGTVTITLDRLDLTPDMKPEKPETTEAVLALFDKGAADAREKLAATSDADFMKPWTLAMGGHDIFTMPKVAVFRNMVMNHMIHHRAQLGMYLRLNDVPVPAVYGPSADEQS